MSDINTLPGTTVRTLLRVATANNEERFVSYALVTYFKRIMNASCRKLNSYGLRPVVAPVAAELALNRAKAARTYPEFVAKLIDGDPYVAELAMRAVHFQVTQLENTSTAAQSVRRNLLCITPRAVQA
ncbi:hypothetical protein PT7_0238 [Pusillimonas sp. T7-7]|uniref:hypothetical protein n=1 Tax=Pusillimonas sp. (strain T7-7) TaxID=1007105 RepID=UPI00020849A5|nr:hypothetical protein [Pusillimonas sp. T7-7]AEC18778.1 hypothetical protein PT7_0238 [Pusillimonas sp. T7-7]